MEKTPENSVLIVDDDPVNLKLLEAFLAAHYIIYTADRGELALKIIESESIDLVLLDIMMPEMDGYEVCRQIKSSSTTFFIPVVMITALHSRDNRLAGLEAGADEFLVKPVDRLEVLVRVRSLIKNKILYDEVKHEKEKAQKFLDISGCMIVAFNADGTIKLVNRKCCEVLGYNESDLLGKKWTDTVISSDNSDNFSSLFEILSLTTADVVRVFDSSVITKQGEKRIIHWSNSIFRDSRGVAGILSSGSDITEERLSAMKLKVSEEQILSYAEELAQKNKELKSLDRMKDEFISNLSHELKTPLISIKGYSELVHDEVLGPLNSKQKNAMKTVLNKYDSLSFLLDSLIYMSIVRSGKVQYRLEPIRIVDSLNKVIDYFEFRSQEKDLILLVDIEDSLPLINGDVEYMPYLFRSIIDNAIKFSPSGSTVLIKAFNDGGSVHVIVRDSGIGIPKNELPHIFRRFYQVDGSMSRKYGGSGLGLYVSKTIARIHGGKIWIESEEGSGTTVHVVIPPLSPENMEKMNHGVLLHE